MESTMKTEYVQTDFPTITDRCRESFRIRGRARGVHLVPLAIGEKQPEAQADADDCTYPHAVNLATAEQLSDICGIGQELGEAIVAYRETFGPFECAEGLEAIAGIGQKTAAKIWAHK